MAASDKAQSDQGAKKEIADGMSDSGKSGGAPSSGGTSGTGTQPKRGGSDEVTQGMAESGSGKPSSGSDKQ